MVRREAGAAVTGRGLEDDRYHDASGFAWWFAGPIRDVALIEWEVLETLRWENDRPLAVEPGATRHDIVTRGAPLGHLLGRRVRVGGATLRGAEIREPCQHLIELTGSRPLVSGPRRLRRGPHAGVIEGGESRPGDAITVIDAEPDADEVILTRRKRQGPGGE